MREFLSAVEKRNQKMLAQACLHTDNSLLHGGLFSIGSSGIRFDAFTSPGTRAMLEKDHEDGEAQSFSSV